MKRCASILVPLLIWLLASSGGLHAKNLGVFGAVYAIAEKDALKEIEERAAKADLKQIVNRDELAKKLRHYTPEDLRAVKDLPVARKERSFLVDMTYILEEDIADDRGNVVYTKGYTFNPLDYVVYPRTLVILNGARQEQVAWFKASPYSSDLTAKVLITNGSYADLSKVLKRPVFYASQPLIETFRIRAVPSVVQQKGRFMEVREIAVIQNKRP
jgi:conjugal transfer pilus assembly protein TraW